MAAMIILISALPFPPKAQKKNDKRRVSYDSRRRLVMAPDVDRARPHYDPRPRVVLLRNGTEQERAVADLPLRAVTGHCLLPMVPVWVVARIQLKLDIAVHW